jgi:hypothetical protein
MDHQHVGTFVETIHRAYLDTVGMLALDTVFSNYKGHGVSKVLKRLDILADDAALSR